MNKKWHLDPKEVVRTGCSSMSGQRSKASSVSRAVSLTGCEITLIHTPTKISVRGNIPVGHYAKKEMVTRQKELAKKLFAQLETEVAKHLRIPGR